MMKPSRLLLLLAAALTSFAFTAAADSEDKPQPQPTVDTCPVSGEKLGSMGAPYHLVHRVEGKPDRDVFLCCEMCVGRFNSNPARFLAKLDELEDAADHKDAAPDRPAPSERTTPRK